MIKVTVNQVAAMVYDDMADISTNTPVEAVIVAKAEDKEPLMGITGAELMRIGAQDFQPDYVYNFMPDMYTRVGESKEPRTCSTR